MNVEVWSPVVTRRNLLILAACTSVTTVVPPFLEPEGRAEAQEGLDLFTYEIERTEFNDQGVLVIVLNGFDTRINVREGETQKDHMAHQFGPLAHQNPFSMELVERIAREYGEHLGGYDITLLVPVQVFPVEDDTIGSIPMSMFPARYKQHIPSLAGGIQNANYVYMVHDHPNRYYRGQRGMELFIGHEISHMEDALFPAFIILDDGQEIPFANDWMHLMNLNYYHPHNSPIGNPPGSTSIENIEGVSPVQLFVMGLMTIEEFNEAFDGGRPYIIKEDPSSGQQEKIYYTAENLIDAMKNPDAGGMFHPRTIAEEINRRRGVAGADFVPGYRKRQDGTALKVGIIPVMMYAEETPEPSDDKTANVLRVLEQISETMTYRSFDCLEAEVIVNVGK